MDISTYELTAIIVFKSLWWILPMLGALEAAIIVEHFDRR